MKVGVTATREGLSPNQRSELRQELIRLGATELHHGDCVGGDADAHAIAVELGIRVVVHPPLNPKGRAFCQGDEARPPKDYLVRNHDIVDETKVTIGLPLTHHEVLRSGTWATIRYARLHSKSIIIHPDEGNEK
jgi:hypothetical protein